jgi:hypothetical protein
MRVQLGNTSYLQMTGWDGDRSLAGEKFTGILLCILMLGNADKLWENMRTFTER